jgi:hypothetical protein
LIVELPTPILRAVDEQGVLHMRTLLGNTRIVARFENPLFNYQLKLLYMERREGTPHFW